MQHIEFQDPQKAKFYTVSLRPSWFINTDCQEITFRAVEWINIDSIFIKSYIESELKNVTDLDNVKELFTITCRQLAKNAENNNRFEEASHFRRIAFQTEWLVKKGKAKVGRKRVSELFITGVDCPIKSLTFFSEIKAISKEILQEFFSSQVLIVRRLYGYSSKFGESWGRAFWILMGILFLSTILYVSPFSKFGAENRSLGIAESIAFSLRTMALQRPEPFPENDFAKVVVALETVFAPLQLALLVLAVRRKFMS